MLMPEEGTDTYRIPVQRSVSERSDEANPAHVIVEYNAFGSDHPRGNRLAAAYLLRGQVDPQRLTPEEVARAVQITPRGDDVFFQAPPIQAIKVVDLRSAGADMGVEHVVLAGVQFNLAEIFRP